MRGRASPLRLARLPEPAFDPADARRAVDEVLSRPEYADLEPGLLERALDALLMQFARAVSALEGTGFGTVIGAVVLVAALALAGWLIARFVRGVRRDPAAGVAVEGELGRTPRDWLEEAERHEAGGRLREAVRCRYRALVAALAARGVVEEVPGRTTGEYLEEVRRAAPAAAPAFAAVTASFEEAWYGSGTVTPEELGRLRDDARAAEGAGRERVAP